MEKQIAKACQKAEVLEAKVKHLRKALTKSKSDLTMTRSSLAKTKASMDSKGRSRIGEAKQSG